jgi:hypothetical protein
MGVARSVDADVNEEDDDEEGEEGGRVREGVVGSESWLLVGEWESG